MRILAALFFPLLMSATANAMWMAFSDAELIAKSDLIVMGEIAKTRLIKLSDGQPSLNAAVLNIGEVLKGRENPVEALLIIPSADTPISSTDITYRPGQKGLWFLRERPEPNGGQPLYLADHPQRLIPAEQIDRINTFRNLLRPAP
jgi:hypothetical protein